MAILKEEEEYKKRLERAKKLRNSVGIYKTDEIKNSNTNIVSNSSADFQSNLERAKKLRQSMGIYKSDELQNITSKIETNKSNVEKTDNTDDVTVTTYEAENEANKQQEEPKSDSIYKLAQSGSLYENGNIDLDNYIAENSKPVSTAIIKKDNNEIVNQNNKYQFGYSQAVNTSKGIKENTSLGFINAAMQIPYYMENEMMVNSPDYAQNIENLYMRSSNVSSQDKLLYQMAKEGKLYSEEGKQIKSEDLNIDTNLTRQMLSENIDKNQAKIQKNIDVITNPVDKKIAEIAPSIGQQAVSMPLSAINPTLGATVFSLSAAGGYLKDAQDRGMNLNDSVNYATIMGIIEGATEQIPIGKMFSTGKNISKSMFKEALKDFGISVTENAIQEAIIEPLSEITATITAGKEYANWENMPQRIFDSAINGALMSIIMNGATANIGSAQNIYNKAINGENITENELKQAVQECQDLVDLEAILRDSMLEQIVVNTSELQNFYTTQFNQNGEIESVKIVNGKEIANPNENIKTLPVIIKNKDTNTYNIIDKATGLLLDSSPYTTLIQAEAEFASKMINLDEASIKGINDKIVQANISINEEIGKVIQETESQLRNTSKNVENDHTAALNDETTNYSSDNANLNMEQNNSNNALKNIAKLVSQISENSIYQGTKVRNAFNSISKDIPNIKVIEQSGNTYINSLDKEGNVVYQQKLQARPYTGRQVINLINNAMESADLSNVNASENAQNDRRAASSKTVTNVSFNESKTNVEQNKDNVKKQGGNQYGNIRQEVNTINKEENKKRERTIEKDNERIKKKLSQGLRNYETEKHRSLGKDFKATIVEKNKYSKNEKAVVQGFKETTGIDITIYETNKTTSEGAFYSEGGIYQKHNSLAGNKSTNFKAYHEYGHWLKEYHKEQWKTIYDIIDKSITKKQINDYINILNDTSMLNNMTELEKSDYIINEIVSDYIGNWANNIENWLPFIEKQQISQEYAEFLADITLNNENYGYNVFGSIEQQEQVYTEISNIMEAIIGLEKNQNNDIQIKYSDRELNEYSENAKKDINNLQKQLNDWLNLKLKPDQPINVGNTPNQLLLKNTNIKKLPIVMNQDVVVKATGGKHSISLEEIAKIPGELEKPILIMEGSVPDSFMVLTNLIAKDSNNVFVALHFNKYQKRLKVNRIASIYGKNNLSNFLKKNIKENKILQVDSKKLKELFTNRGLQLPKLVQTTLIDNSIPQKNNSVKTITNSNMQKETKYSDRIDTDKNEQGGFYSQLENVIEQKMPNISNNQQILNLLKNNGIKQDELDWTGIEDYLNTKGNEKVTKQEVLDYIMENQLQIEEVKKGDSKVRELKEPIEEDIKSKKVQLETLLAKYNIPYDNNLDPIYPDKPTGILGDYMVESLKTLVNLDNFEKTEAIEVFRDKDWNIVRTPVEKYTSTYKLLDDPTIYHSEFTLERLEADLQRIEDYYDEINEAEINLSMIEDEYGDNADEIGVPKYKSYRTKFDGGENYKEVLYRLPSEVTENKKIDTYGSPHWNEDNILAHTRLQDYTDIEGNKVLFIEEIQSDLHQDGRKEGYQKKYAEEERVALINERVKAQERYEYLEKTSTNPEERGKAFIKYSEAVRALETFNQNNNIGGIDEQFPFKKNWHEFVLRRIINDAVLQGYDKVAWTTGKQQNQRYDLAQYVDKIQYHTYQNPDNESEKLYNINAIKDESSVISRGGINESRLKELLGKDISNKIINSNTYDGVIEEENLSVGGEGMKGFYDKIIPDYLSKYLKKWNSKIEDVFIGDNKQQGFTITPEMKNAIATQGQPLYSNRDLDNEKESTHEQFEQQRKKERIEVAKMIKERSFFTTVYNSNIPKDFKSKLQKERNSYQYEPISNQETLNKANEKIRNINNIKDEFLQNELKSAEDTAIGELLIKKAIEKGDYSEASNLTASLAEKLTTAGQTIQAAAMFKKMTSEGMLIFAQKKVNKINDELKKKYKLNEVLTKNKAPQIELTDEKIQFIDSLMKQMEELEQKKQAITDGETLAIIEREEDIIIAKIVAKIGEDVPVTILDKVTAWRNIALLLNPKTIVRNLVSNSLFSTLENVTDVVGVGIDKALALVTGERSILIPGLKTQKIGFNKGLNYAIEDSKLGISTSLGGNKYEIKADKIFKNKIMQKLETASYLGVEGLDRPFMQAKYESALEMIMKLEGLVYGKDIATEEMKQEALEIAKYTTFKDKNAISDFLSKTKKVLNANKSIGLSDVIGLTYTNIPGNLTKKAIDYSPVGLYNIIKAYQNLKSKQLNSEKTRQAQRELVQATSRTLIGSGVMTLSIQALLAGILTASGDDEDRKIQDITGEENYAINVTAFLRWITGGDTTPQNGDLYVTYSNYEPLSSIIASSAEMAKASQKGEDAGTVIYKGLTTWINTIAELSTLSNFSSLFEYGDLGGTLVRSLSQFPASFIPTFSKQIAQFFETDSKSSYSDNYIMKNVIYPIMQKVPVLSSMLESNYDTMGNEEKSFNNSKGLARLYNVFLNPSYTSTVDMSETKQELYDLYLSTGSTDHLPLEVKNYFTYNGERINLTSEEKAEYQEKLGKATSEAFEEIMQTTEYKNMTDEEKVEALSSIITDLKKDIRGDVILEPRGLAYDTRFSLSSSTLKMNGYSLELTEEMQLEYEKVASDRYSQYEKQGIYSKEKLEQLESQCKDYAKQYLIKKYRNQLKRTK